MYDMSVDELRKYMGSTPKANDFEEYWERGLQEMRRVEANIEWKKADFTVPYADCFDLYYTGVKNARIHAKVIIPKKKARLFPALLTFHGYSSRCGSWTSKMQYAAAGFVVAAMDCRGQGGASEDSGGVKGTTFQGHFIRGLDGEADHMLMRNIFLDTAQLAGIIMELPEVDEMRIDVYGGSQGGALSIACAGLERRISRISVQYPFLSDYKRALEMDSPDSAYQELKNYFRLFDPQHLKEREIFERLSYIDVQNFAGKIKGTVQMGASLMDITCPPSTQFAVFNKLNCEKSIYMFYEYGHENLPDYDDMEMRFFLKDWI